MSDIEIRSEIQKNPVADEVSALIAVVRPILVGLLYALKEEVVREIGTYEDISLRMLPRLYLPGDGDCGICYEYAVHDAVIREEPGAEIESILFGIEKKGASQLIATAGEILTDDSRILTGQRSQPPK